MKISYVLSASVLSLLCAQTVFAAPVKDNSFLIEEAYNQEPGVVQFIQGWQYSDLSKELELYIYE